MAKYRQGGNVLLTTEQVIKIRQLARERLPSGKLAHSANAIAGMLQDWTGLAMSAEAIRKVIRRETWRHVPDVDTVGEAEAAMAPELSPSKKMEMQASALKMFKFQEELRGQKVLDELTGETTPPTTTKENEK